MAAGWGIQGSLDVQTEKRGLKMSKIPKNLTDKDMFKDYVEDMSIEDHFVRAEKAAKKKRQETIEPPADLARAGFTPQLTEELGRALLQLKMELFRAGVKSYTFKIKREGENIVLIPKYKQ